MRLAELQSLRTSLSCELPLAAALPSICKIPLGA